jgi:hypothetical protein
MNSKVDSGIKSFYLNLETTADEINTNISLLADGGAPIKLIKKLSKSYVAALEAMEAMKECGLLGKE